MMWYLTATAHEFRDKATLALFCFGQGDPSALLSLTIDSLSISDPYVPERMLAASYGALTAVQADIKYKDFLTLILPSHAKNIYEKMFQKDAHYGTTHILMRDYARGIIQIAALHNKNLFSKDELKRITPPYKDIGIREWEKNIPEGNEVFGVKTPFNMDFENYKLGSLVPERGNYDFKNPEYLKVRSQILWRVSQLGWDFERFNKVDSQIASQNEIFRTNGGSRKIDRYGKKYSLIAYYEMDGFLRDTKKTESSNNKRRSWDVDIDPSFPLPPKQEKLIKEDFLGSESVSIREWIENGAMPNVAPYFRQNIVHSYEGPWIVLDGSLLQEDKVRGRRLFCFIRSFLVPVSKAKSLVTALSNQSMKGRWLPDKPTTRAMFAGEFPWSIAFPKNGKTQLRFVIDERKVKKRRKRTVYFLDGKQVGTSPLFYARFGSLGLVSPSDKDAITPDKLDRIQSRTMTLEIEEIEQKIKKFDVIIPVCDFGWEGTNIDDISVHSTMVAKEIATKLDLVGIPQSVDAATKDGRRATCAIASQGHAYFNRQHMFFIHEKLLRTLLEKEQLSLVWVAWGERQISVSLASSRELDTDKYGQGFSVFSKVTQFS